MENVWVLAALWVGLALIATLLAIWFRISTALSEIVVGTVAQLIIGAVIGIHGGLGAKTNWIGFLAGTGAIVLTFLAGAELDPAIFKTKWKEALTVGLVGFIGPFLGCTAIAHFVLHWSVRSSWLAGVALSTTSVAVVYAVMLDIHLPNTHIHRGVHCCVRGPAVSYSEVLPSLWRTRVGVGGKVPLVPAVRDGWPSGVGRQ